MFLKILSSIIALVSGAQATGTINASTFLTIFSNSSNGQYPTIFPSSEIDVRLHIGAYFQDEGQRDSLVYESIPKLGVMKLLLGFHISIDG
jgi:hypothetical protein